MFPRATGLSAVLALSLLAPVARAQTAPVRPSVTVPAGELPDRQTEEKDLEQFEATARARTRQQHPTPTLAQETTHEQVASKTESPKPALSHHPLHLSLLPVLSTGGVSDPRVSTNVSVNVVAGHVGELRGIEFGSAVNSVGHRMSGAQFAGAVNVVGGDANGAQFAGAVNVAAGKVHGAQFAGAVNVAAESLSGAQFSGGVNIAGKVDVGAQIGVLNIGGDVSGAQIGVVNIARKVKGAQIGVLNFADDVDGASVGVLSFVRKGQLHLDIWTADTTLANASLRFGSKRVYTLLNLGYDPTGEGRRWSAGLGIGARLDAGRFFATADVSANSSYDGFRATSSNILTQGRALVGFKIFDHLAIFGGPTLNVNVDVDRVERFGFRWGWESRSGSTRIWPGFAAGIEI